MLIRLKQGISGRAQDSTKLCEVLKAPSVGELRLTKAPSVFELRLLTGPIVGELRLLTAVGRPYCH